MHSHNFTHTCHIHTHKYTHWHENTFTYTLKNKPTYVHNSTTDTIIHTTSYRLTNINKPTHTNTHINTHTYTHRHANKNISTYYRRIHMYTATHRRTVT